MFPLYCLPLRVSALLFHATSIYCLALYSSLPLFSFASTHVHNKQSSLRLSEPLFPATSMNSLALHSSVFIISFASKCRAYCLYVCPGSASKVFTLPYSILRHYYIPLPPRIEQSFHLRPPIIMCSVPSPYHIPSSPRVQKTATTFTCAGISVSS